MPQLTLSGFPFAGVALPLMVPSVNHTIVKNDHYIGKGEDGHIEPGAKACSNEISEC
jgi:hypothetical protein